MPDPMYPRRLRPTDMPVRISRPRCAHTVNLPGEARYFVNVLIEGGVPRDQAYALDCADVHPMAQHVARANYLARSERRLLLDEYPPPPPPQGYNRRSLALAGTLIMLTVAGLVTAVILICSPVWRFLT